MGAASENIIKTSGNIHRAGWFYATPVLCRHGDISSLRCDTDSLQVEFLRFATLQTSAWSEVLHINLTLETLVHDDRWT
jgi:hypothetical protein